MENLIERNELKKYIMYFYDFGERGFLYGIQDMKSIDFYGIFAVKMMC